MKKVILTLSDEEGIILETLCKKYGYRGTAYLRHLLSNEWRFERGGYKAAENDKVRVKKEKPVKPENSMAIEQYCEYRGGKVTKNDQGVRVCFFQTGFNQLYNKALGVSVPLAKESIIEYAGKE